MDPATRAEKGRQSAEAFRKWMGSYRTAEAAREEEAGPSPGYGASDSLGGVSDGRRRDSEGRSSLAGSERELMSLA